MRRRTERCPHPRLCGVTFHMVGSSAHAACRSRGTVSGLGTTGGSNVAPPVVGELDEVAASSTVHWETVTPTMRDVAQRLFASRLGGSYRLAGGTGLSLQLGHRRSNDLDLFPERTDGTLDRPSIKSFLDQFGAAAYAVDQSSEVTAVVHGVKVSFVAYPFPWRHDPDRAGSLRVASAREILQMKAYALGRRGTARDYADIAAGLREAVTTLADLVVESEGRFVLNGEAQFSERLFLQQLAYTDDIPESEKQAVTSELVSGTFEDMTAEIGRHLRSYLEDLGNDR